MQNRKKKFLSKASINIADPKTGVITTSALSINKIVIDINGNNMRRFRKPGIDNVRRVANKFTIEIVVLIPA
jgi:hypothetical protein